MIRRHILSSSLVVAVAAAMPALAIVVAQSFDATSKTMVLTSLAATLVAVAFGALALRRIWSDVQTPLDQAADLLQSPNAEIDRLARLIEGAFHDRDRLLSDVEHHRDQLLHITESFDEPVLVVTQEETIIFANKSAAEFLQISQERLVGSQSPQSITQAPLLVAIRRALVGGRHRARADLGTHRGARIYNVSSGPIEIGPDENGALLILRDVTDLARAAQMKTDFVANASHELRTPLAAIRAALDTARIAAEENPEQMMRFIDMAPAHLTRLEEMTRDLIDLSRLESPDLKLSGEPLAVNDLCDSLLALLNDHANRRNVTIDIDMAEGVHGFKTDPRLVHLVLKNLLDNAIKFCNEGSSVRLVAAIAMGGDARRRARFEVRDEGVGIPLNQQQRVFERFYQGDGARQGSGASAKRGTGLGLSIVKHAVTALGGEVGLESVYQHGTTIWFVIPELSMHEAPANSDSDDADLKEFER
jgi:two-component system phosphate regulon sensor histidine kinase PhoR